MTDFNQIVKKVKDFNLERDWDQFHNPKDILLALLSEVGELAELYRWLNLEEIEKVHQDKEKKQKIEEELADIAMYLLTLAYKTNTNLLDAIEKKLEKNKQRYPIEKVKGIHSNPMQGYKG